MVARRFRVPRFPSLRHFVIARRQHLHQWYQPGPERDDLGERLGRHIIDPTWVHINPTLRLLIPHLYTSTIQ